MFCEQCGRANSQGSAFCEGCGAAIASPVAPAAQPIAPTLIPPAPNAPFAAAPIVGDQPARTRAKRPIAQRVALLVAGVVVGVVAGVGARDLGAFDFIRGERFDTAQVEAREEASRAAGEKSGYADGFSEGKAAGEEAGYDEGFEAGKSEGENRAYNGAGTSISRVRWSDNLDSGESGICVDLTGTYLLSSWKWVFEFSDGTVDTIDDNDFDRSESAWCYSESTLDLYTDVDRLWDASLTIYVTRNSMTDRWGPLQSPWG